MSKIIKIGLSPDIEFIFVERKDKKQQILSSISTVFFFFFWSYSWLKCSTRQYLYSTNGIIL